MDEPRKHAYRWLLYWAMLDIRPLLWIGGGWRQRWNPWCWWSCSRQVRCAGAIADWLHNLALSSALDFAQFDEEWFWRDYQWMLDNHPGCGLERYRMVFEERMSPAELEEAEQTVAPDGPGHDGNSGREGAAGPPRT
jgi:hypothetical protein